MYDSAVVGSGVGLMVAVPLVTLLVFFVFRGFWTWYWKQSQQLAVLKEIRDSLRALEARPGALGLATPAVRTPLPASPPRPKKSWQDALLDRLAGVP